MSEPTPASAVSLREVTEDNLFAILNLNVDQAQERFVAPNDVSIAQAYFARERAWFRAIYAGETPVGFLMLDDDPHKPEYFLWRLMVDANYQGKGFGFRAMELLIAHVKTRPGAVELKTSYSPGDGSPLGFYRKVGFIETGEIIENEHVMSLKFEAADGDILVPPVESASDEIRALLLKFQEGYTRRDPANLNAFMELFGPDDELEVIGTNATTPGIGEWCKGRAAVSRLVEGDWEHWGDLLIDMDLARITVKDDVAWLSTTGTITDVISAESKYKDFTDYARDLLEDEKGSPKAKMLDITRTGNYLVSSLLLPDKCVWPFRFSAVAVKSKDTWRFHQMQFSFATTDWPDERILPDE